MHFTGQIFALDSDVTTQKVFSSHRDFLTYAMNHNREIIKSSIVTVQSKVVMMGEPQCVLVATMFLEFLD